MARRSARLEIEEISGNQYPDLETVQGLILPGLAADLARVLRKLLETGALIVCDGTITVNPDSDG